jgi:hypothetical protein
VPAGFLTSPSPFQLFAFDLPNELIRQFPLVLVPVFLVPVSVLLHRRIIGGRRPAGAARDGRGLDTFCPFIQAAQTSAFGLPCFIQVSFSAPL